MHPIESYDYIIVGAGSAGCVLADRLSADGQNRVLLLEFGGSDRSIFIQMPAALAYPMHSKRWNWGYESEPEPHLGGRRLHCARSAPRYLGQVLRPHAGADSTVFMTHFLSSSSSTSLERSRV